MKNKANFTIQWPGKWLLILIILCLGEPDILDELINILAAIANYLNKG